MKKIVFVLFLVSFFSISALDVFSCRDCAVMEDPGTHICAVCHTIVATLEVFTDHITFAQSAFWLNPEPKAVTELAVLIEKPPQYLL